LGRRRGSDPGPSRRQKPISLGLRRWLIDTKACGPVNGQRPCCRRALSAWLRIPMKLAGVPI
jgi:hypothetical protein